MQLAVKDESRKSVDEEEKQDERGDLSAEEKKKKKRLRIMYSIVYFFLRLFFRWVGNFKRKLAIDKSINKLSVL